ncbi:MAG: hypothetical protein K2X45_04745 [Phreatobacter sp.]|nr:hypothetical protein [Phreatobacter sp.]
MELSLELQEALHGNGLPIRELFRLHIGSDATLTAMIAEVDGVIFDKEHCCDCVGTLDGDLTIRNPAWPPSIRDFDLVSEWLDDEGRHLGKLKPWEKRGFFDWIDGNEGLERRYYRIARAAEERLKHLYAEMIGRFCTGEFVATGYRFNVDEASYIPRAIWSSDVTRIAFTLNELRRYEGDHISREAGGVPCRVEDTLVDWIGVMAAWREDLNNPPEKDLGGRPPKYEWDAAYDELMCIIAEDGLPGTRLKDDLGRQFQSAFVNLEYRVPDLKLANAWLSTRNPKLWLMVKPKRA